MKMVKYILTIIVMVGLFSCKGIDECEIVDSDNEPIVSERLGLKLYHLKNDLFEVEYDDGRLLTIHEQDQGSFIITGSRISHESIGIHFGQSDDNSFDNMVYYNNSKNSTITRNEFIFMVNGYIKSPCSEHPDEESLKNCFKREVDEFCNSLISCTFLAANARLVATLIAIHCVYCN